MNTSSSTPPFDPAAARCEWGADCDRPPTACALIVAGCLLPTYLCAEHVDAMAAEVDRVNTLMQVVNTVVSVN